MSHWGDMYSVTVKGGGVNDQIKGNRTYIRKYLCNMLDMNTDAANKYTDGTQKSFTWCGQSVAIMPTGKRQG